MTWANKVSRQAANDYSTSIQNTTKSVNAETVRVVSAQMSDFGVQMKDLDDFVTRARSENSGHHAQHVKSVDSLSNTVEASFSTISAQFTSTFDRVRELGDEMDVETGNIRGALAPLDEEVCEPLGDLRDEINSTVLKEYEPTGDTPEKTGYQYPTELPRTEAHEVLIARMHDAPTPSRPTTSLATTIFSDPDLSGLGPVVSPKPSARTINSFSMSLREVNPNLTTGAIMFDPSASTMSMPAIREDNATMPLPLFKRSTSIRPPNMVTRGSKKQQVMPLEGRENVPPGGVLTQGLPRRKSPRLA
jgi:kinesin family protein 11